MTSLTVSLAVLVFCAIFYSTDAGCRYASQCIDSNGTLYEIGGEWTERYEDHCDECECYEFGAGCCSTGSIISLPDHCVDIFDSDNCVHHVVEKSNPCQQCTGPHSAVGK
ncbi:beta-microseminoprotein-like [Anneissia japonica]|uniref:beta-microseminoprotein-like n=1 Tax=Anneissia japonica TaxID=1529436 RepID=UPI0014254E03|nr:beta-microseminoprotein-like [Anneissia japonica]